MVKDKWWKAAINIKEKDYLELSNGSYEEVIGVRNEIKEYSIKIYNITVDGKHNYYIGTEEILTQMDFKGKVSSNDVGWERSVSKHFNELLEKI